MDWSEEAAKELEKAPGFVRNMAKKAVEKAVRKDGRNFVTVEDVRQGRENYISFGEKKPGDEKKQRIAVVRCDIVSEVCPGDSLFQSL